MDNVYQKDSISEVDGVPCFSVLDDYIENYEKISQDHLKVFLNTGHNPFMREDHWNEVENSTADLIKKYSNHKMKILDVGVGLGRLLEKFPELDRYGIDISDGYLNESKKKGIKVCKSLIDDMPYKNNMFDIVVTTDVLEHVLDLNKSFEKILSVLKNDGILIIRVPYKEDLKYYASDECPYELVHLRIFEEYSMQMFVEKIFKQKLLEITYSGYISGRHKFKNLILKKLLKISMNIINMVNGNLFYKLARVFNHPAEINFVIRKVSYENKNQSNK